MVASLFSTGSPGDLKLSVAGDRVSAGPAQGWLTWQGLSGEGLGGLEARQSALARGRMPHGFARAGIAAQQPRGFDTASSKPLAARWWAPLRLEADDALSTNPYGLLTGELHNPLPLELTECLLIYDEWLYRIERLPPGSRVAVSSLAARNLEAVLTRRTVVDTKDLSTAWDPGSVDTPRLVQMLMFHNAARRWPTPGSPIAFSRSWIGATSFAMAVRCWSAQCGSRWQSCKSLGEAESSRANLSHKVGVGCGSPFPFASSPPSRRPDAMIKTVDLTKKYGDSYAIREINLDLAAGDLFPVLSAPTAPAKPP